MRGQAAASPQGFGGLGSILAGLGGGRLLSNVIAPETTNISQGNDVLRQIFGNKDASRADHVEDYVSKGQLVSVLKRLVPLRCRAIISISRAVVTLYQHLLCWWMRSETGVAHRKQPESKSGCFRTSGA